MDKFGSLVISDQPSHSFSFRNPTPTPKKFFFDFDSNSDPENDFFFAPTPKNFIFAILTPSPSESESGFGVRCNSLLVIQRLSKKSIPKFCLIRLNYCCFFSVTMASIRLTLTAGTFESPSS
jgi:hypothetical protein